MAGIFDETNMRQLLGKYIPYGEMLQAGIHAISHETHIQGIFGKCSCTENGLVPDENGSTIVLNKKKYASYDIYIGITEHFLVIADCEKESYLYEFDNESGTVSSDVQEITSELLFADIGTCFAFEQIRNCEIKKGWMGSVKCYVTMKNESYFKLMFPKLGGVGGGMPHHAAYRDMIIDRLGRY